jgi:hypothetical protein
MRTLTHSLFPLGSPRSAALLPRLALRAALLLRPAR